MIEFIKLEDFKSFHQAEAHLGRLTLIVGANAAGKSNIREALRVLHGAGRGYSIAEMLGEKWGAGGVREWSGIRGGAHDAGFEGAAVFGIEVAIRMPEKPPYAGRLFTWGLSVHLTDQAGPRVVREFLRHSSGFVYDSNPPDDPLEQKGDHQLSVRYPRNSINRRRGKVIDLASARPALSQLADRGEPTSVRDICRAVRDTLATFRFLDLEPDAMRRPSPPGQVVLGDRGENLSSVLQAICADPAREATLLQWVRALTPLDAVDFDFRSDFEGRVMVHLKEGSGHITSAVSASDGTLRFLALVAALLSRDTGRIYFFEEFDNGIHPTRLHLLLDLVQRACKSEDVQVIGTTHNPALLADLDDHARNDALLVYRSEYSKGSKIRRMTSLPDFREIVRTRDLGRLHQSGWLETAAIFSEPDEEEV